MTLGVGTAADTELNRTMVRDGCAAVLFQSCRGAFPGREVRIRMHLLLKPVLRVTILSFIHVRLDEMGVLEDAVSLDDVQVNAVRTAAAPAVVHRAALFVPGVEYVIADHQLCELLKGVIAEDASAAHGVHRRCRPQPMQSLGAMHV
jgi:hypothetical protein